MSELNPLLDDKTVEVLTDNPGRGNAKRVLKCGLLSQVGKNFATVLGWIGFDKNTIVSSGLYGDQEDAQIDVFHTRQTCEACQAFGIACHPRTRMVPIGESGSEQFRVDTYAQLGARRGQQVIENGFNGPTGQVSDDEWNRRIRAGWTRERIGYDYSRDWKSVNTEITKDRKSGFGVILAGARNFVARAMRRR